MPEFKMCLVSEYRKNNLLSISYATPSSDYTHKPDQYVDNKCIIYDSIKFCRQ